MERWIIGAAALFALLMGSLIGAWNTITSHRLPAAPSQTAAKPAEIHPRRATTEPKALQPAPTKTDEEPTLDPADVQPHP